MLMQKGIVYLVGAGPGDPKLLTLRGKECLEQADVVLYDYLANEALLGHVSPRAERLYVGRRGRGQYRDQSEINRLLIDHAQAGKRVVRLKGGDPFVFGRGGEEAEAGRGGRAGIRSRARGDRCRGGPCLCGHSCDPSHLGVYRDVRHWA